MVGQIGWVLCPGAYKLNKCPGTERWACSDLGNIASWIWKGSNCKKRSPNNSQKLYKQNRTHTQCYI